VEVIRRIIDASLSEDPGEARDDLHDALVVIRGRDERLERRDAVLEAWAGATAEAPPIAWVEHELAVDVMGASAVVGYRYELDRDAAGGSVISERGHDLWVLTREGDRWLAAYRTTMPEAPGEA
jgi:ketosteroid isomerase-like protein